MRTARGAVMREARLWMTLVTIQGVLWAAGGVSHHHNHHHRRSMPTPTTFSVSKGGWRPVINSGLSGYAPFGAAPLHASSYKIPVPVIDSYQSSSRPVSARDATKLTSIAQSYRPTTHRSLPSTSPSNQPPNQPINSYYNPFGLQNGLHYKFVQNYPLDNVVIRNPHNPYAARPMYSKYPPKFKQNYHQSMMQQLNNVQPLHFGLPAYPTQENYKPQSGDHFARPSEPAKRPHQSSSGIETFKPEVFKLPSDSDTAPQSVSQQVKTAQQQSNNVKPPVNGYAPYKFNDEKYAPIPPTLLGTFSSFGVQSMKGRDHMFPPAKTTFLPPQTSKQTIFNSFSFTPNFKTTSNYFSTTPKLQPSVNNYVYPSTVNDHQTLATQPPKPASPQKVDPNAGTKESFKPSPQDPFSKHFPADINKVQVSTYKPHLPTTPSVSSFYNTNFNLPAQYHQSVQTSYFHQPIIHYENKKQKIHDSLTSNNQQSSTQLPAAVQKKNPEFEATQNSLPRPATYEVTENFENDDIVTHSSANTWTNVPDTQDDEQKHNSDESAPVREDEKSYSKPATTFTPELPEEYAIVTEGDNGYENSLNYDSHVETQSRRPLGDDFEPIHKHKLKDYYYRVSTPVYDEYSTHYKRPKVKSTEGPTANAIVEQETTTPNDLAVKPLPTLPPSKHFKRPVALDVDKDKIRKRIKNRRRRPPLANRDKEESSSVSYSSSTQATDDVDETHTIRPRVRPQKYKSHANNLTTPTISTDLSTSALPTTSPTAPTIVKKKISHRRPSTTTTDKFESTTASYKDDANKDSPIMKIATRQQQPRVTTITFDYKPTETPDYSHKQDEKDTPASDISVGIESLRNKPEKQFSFHKDVKPLEAKLEPIHQGRETTTDTYRNDNTEEASEITTFAPRTENSSEPGKRTRQKNKYENNRPKFSVKDYRNRLSSTTSTEKPSETPVPRLRFPQRRLPFDRFNSDSDNSTERKKFTPKDPRHKTGNNDEAEVTPTERERESHITRSQSTRQRPTTTTTETEGTTQKISARVRNGSRRPRPTEETTETSSPTTIHIKRPQRKKIKDSEISESVQDISVTETTVHYQRDDATSERTRSESAIMKIAKDDKKHQTDHTDIFEHSKRVSDLTLAASKDYNNPGLFKTVSPNSRRIPNYFTIATDDPILPIEAFFPQLNQKKES